MSPQLKEDSNASSNSSPPRAISMEDALLGRLEWNLPVLPHLKDVSPGASTNLDYQRSIGDTHLMTRN